MRWAAMLNLAGVRVVDGRVSVLGEEEGEAPERKW